MSDDVTASADSAHGAAEMPLTDHLEELRWRLLAALVAVAAGACLAYWYADWLFEILVRPLHDAAKGHDVRLIGTGLAEAFFTKLKVSAIAGFVLALPVVLLQVWRFVAPGLHAHERAYVIPFVLFGTLFFLAGAAFCWRYVF
ncbi:twin-arginine translocase subunit TatC, partial [bacterium]|nr:twin-arginine translocase subunit TatC [bacterium]